MTPHPACIVAALAVAAVLSSAQTAPPSERCSEVAAVAVAPDSPPMAGHAINSMGTGASRHAINSKGTGSFRWAPATPTADPTTPAGKGHDIAKTCVRNVR